MIQQLDRTNFLPEDLGTDRDRKWVKNIKIINGFTLFKFKLLLPGLNYSRGKELLTLNIIRGVCNIHTAPVFPDSKPASPVRILT